MVRKKSPNNWSEIGRDKEANVSATEAKITENLEKQYLIKCHEEVQENELWEENCWNLYGSFSIWGKLRLSAEDDSQAQWELDERQSDKKEGVKGDMFFTEIWQWWWWKTTTTKGQKGQNSSQIFMKTEET